MGCFQGQHANITNCKGICLTPKPQLLFMDFTEHGNLRTLLRGTCPLVTMPCCTPPCCVSPISNCSIATIRFKMAQNLDSRCVFAIFIGSQHLRCLGSQPKHVLNPAYRTFNPILFFRFVTAWHPRARHAHPRASQAQFKSNYDAPTSGFEMCFCKIYRIPAPLVPLVPGVPTKNTSRICNKEVYNPHSIYDSVFQARHAVICKYELNGGCKNPRYRHGIFHRFKTRFLFYGAVSVPVL